MTNKKSKSNMKLRISNSKNNKIPINLENLKSHKNPIY